LLRLHENLENEVMVFCLVGQVIDTNPNDSELWVVYKRSGGTTERWRSQECQLLPIRTPLIGEAFFCLTNFVISTALQVYLVYSSYICCWDRSKAKH
jgi:hypothetical protein